MVPVLGDNAYSVLNVPQNGCATLVGWTFGSPCTSAIARMTLVDRVFLSSLVFLHALSSLLLIFRLLAVKEIGTGHTRLIEGRKQCILFPPHGNTSETGS